MGYGKPQMTTLIVHSSLLLSFLASLAQSVNGQYRWRTDSWSECRKSYGNCGPGGLQTRNVWCEKSYPVLQVVPRALCSDAGHEPRREQSCYKVCDPREDYRVKWVEGRWSECQTETDGKDCARNLGFQTRDVYCAYTSTGVRTEDSVCESFMQNKPPMRQPCEYNCPQNCVVGEFSEWSSCDDCRFLNRSRTRNIIVPNNHGGKPCPPFFEMSPCSNCSNKYFLNFTPWTYCQVFTDSFNSRIPYNPHIGNQERSFDCFNIRGQKEELSKCTGKFQPIAYRQSCIISQDCVLGPWQELTTINQTCVTENNVVKSGYLYRKRDVIQIPLGDGKPCDPLEEYTPIQSSQKFNCPRTQWIMSDWSECKPIHGHQQCNTGIQQLHIICVQIDQNGKQTPVDESECSPEKRPLTSRTCPTQCKTDCTVSIWSQWSQCKVTDCDMYVRRRRNNKKTGQRYRTRTVTTDPAQGGQACPHLSETQNCDPEPCYNWVVSKGDCTPLQPPCGVGVAQQTVYCFNQNMTRVSDSRCAELKEHPPYQVECVVSCDSDCVVSEWSPWSECPRICQNNVMPGNAIKHRSRTILAKGAVGNCHANLRENGECPTVIECDTYMWQTEPWGRCELDNPIRGCGRGVRARMVGCYNNRTSVSDIKCAMEVKPLDRDVCIVPCPEDCKVSIWSAWSECSATCTSANTPANPSKSRKRYILIHPKNGGALCPNLLKEIKVCLDLPVCNQYQWNVSDWSECILHRQEKCGRGLKARNVTCLLNDGSVSPINNCLVSVGQMPPVAEHCYVACEDECLFTDWTPWTKCLQGCGSKRFRQRRPRVGDKAPPECSDLTRYPRYEQDVCHCDLIKEELGGDFSECILDPPKTPSGLLRPISTSSKRDNQESPKEDGVGCGWGQKIRYVACQSSSAATSLRRCTEAVSLEVKHCNIPCPNDCKMAQWSEWSKCPSKCRPGIQKRSRYIEQLNSAGGRQCPSLDSTQTETQTRLCHPECSLYMWKAYEWGMCDSIGHSCGDGTQGRVVNCVTVNINGDTTGITSEENCAGQVKPHSEQPCRMACVGECVMSDWTEWTECPRPCSRGLHKQTRTRKIMRIASGYNARCGETEQYRDCIIDINCVDYHWVWMPWTSCLINNGQDECGRGLQERFPVCRTHNEVDVDDRICDKIIGPAEQSQRMNDCEVPCDVDCLVSDWSEWSSCSQTCGIGKSTRDRVIVEQYTGNGRKCPPDLVQTKPCHLKGCYRWNISDWSPCMPQTSMCGVGMQTRNVSCLGDDGLPADPEKCPPDLKILVLKTEQKCRVLCPWECVLTEWSEWSKCFVNCADFAIGATQGRTSRSRAIISQGLQPCSDKLWESKFCPARECTDFVWVASPWTNGMRRVSCQTSDGIVVNEEACHDSVRPSVDLFCDPPCHGDHMICNDTNTCGCEAEYSVVTNALGQVVACIQQNTTLSIGAQKKDSEAEIETNYWMYAVVAAGTLFIVFVALALYHMSDFFKNGPRPHGEQKEDKKSVGIESTDTAVRIARQGNENCNVCSQIPAPVDTMVTTSNGRPEVHLADDVGPYVQSWNRKSLANRFADALSRFIPCMSNKNSPHVHENINETRVKLPLESRHLIGHEGNYMRDDSMETEFNDISNLVHTPSYYMAVSMSDAESHRSSKVITLPRDKTDNYLCDSLDTETSSPDSTKSQVKRSQSDSAISTSNSQGVCSRTNSPFVKKDKILKKRAAKSVDYAKSAKHSSTQTSTQSSVDEMVELGTKPTALTYQDSIETQAFPSSNGFTVDENNLMGEYLVKLNSLSGSNDNLKQGEDFLLHEEITAIKDHLPDHQSLSSEGSNNHEEENPEFLQGDSHEEAELQHLLPIVKDQDSIDSKKGFCVFVPNTTEINDEAVMLETQTDREQFSETSQRRDRLSRQRKVDRRDPSESDHNSNTIPGFSGEWSHDNHSPKCNSVNSVNSATGSAEVPDRESVQTRNSRRPLQTSTPREVKSQNSSHKTTPV